MTARRFVAFPFAFGLLLGAAALVTVAATPASAAPAATGLATVRAAHFAPDVPPVDVYVGPSGAARTLLVSNLGYGEVSKYVQVPAGRYQVALLAHGAAASGTPLLSWSINLAAGDTYTAAGEGFGASHHGGLLVDDLTAPPAGHARLRIVQSANAVPSATVAPVGAAPVAAGLGFTQVTPYVSMTAGTWTLAVTGAGQREVQRVAVAAGSVYSLVLLDAQGGGVTLRAVLDAAGATSIPSAAVPAGGGGTAVHVIDRPIAATSAYQVALIAVLVGLGLLGLGVGGRRGLGVGARGAGLRVDGGRIRR